MSLTQRYSLIVQDFATSRKKWSKTSQNFIIRGAFSIKVTKNAKKTRGNMFYTFTGMTSHALNTKFCNFITLIKSAQNFV